MADPSTTPPESTGTPSFPVEPTSEHGNTSTRLILNKLSVYETKTRFYIVGSSQSDNRFRVMKIDRTSPSELAITEDDVVYTSQEISELLAMIEDGNRSTGGLNKVLTAYGIIGFVRFLEGHYISLITKRSAVALIGGHYVYHIDDTALLPICPPGKNNPSHPDESRYIGIFQNVDLTKNFYFSYTYDLTNTLQHNMIVLDTDGQVAKGPRKTGRKKKRNAKYNDMFVWNRSLLEIGFGNLKESDSDWVLPLVHGFVDQAKISVFGQSIFVTLIARRSRLFAGARFLKRGANDQGYVANDVETEQIVHEMATTSFSIPKAKRKDKCPYSKNPRYTSFVQHRGSIPLFWSQDTANMAPKPPIELNVRDPFFSAAALHFDNMFKRYGGPIVVLNLVKQKEKTKRESLLLEEFTQCVAYLNQFLPDGKSIKYIAWDMSRASKSRDQDVIRILEDISEDSVRTTGFFHSGPEPYVNVLRRKWSNEDPTVELDRRPPSYQSGVIRTNCIDCLDRTNAAQFIIGKCALGHQLYALGIIDHPHIPFDSDAATLLTEMYHDHGDTIALQYGGSHLVNTMETYRKLSGWTSHSRDVVETIRRYYSNSFVDAEKQDAINLFLGNFVPAKNPTALWDLTSDYYLHHANPRLKRPKRSYIEWWTKDVFTRNEQLPPPTTTKPIENETQVRHSTLPFFNFQSPKFLPTDVPNSDDRNESLVNNTADISIEKDDGLPESSSVMQPSTEEEEEEDGGYWMEYYRPKLFSSFQRLFAFNMMSTMKMVKEDHYDFSPFSVRKSRTAPTVPPVRLDVGGIRSWLSVTERPSREVGSSVTGTHGSNPAPPSSDSESDSDDDAGTEPTALNLGLPPTMHIGMVYGTGTASTTLGFSNSGNIHPIGTGGSINVYSGGGGVGGGMVIPPAPPPPTILKENGTETVLKRMMEPSVTQTEAKEYRRYINQFRAVPLLSRDKSNGDHPPTSRVQRDYLSTQAERSHPEYLIYAAYIARGSSSATLASPSNEPVRLAGPANNGRPSHRYPPQKTAPPPSGQFLTNQNLPVREVDERVYEAYVTFPGRVLNDLSTGKVTGGRYDEYARWVRTGVVAEQGGWTPSL